MAIEKTKTYKTYGAEGWDRLYATPWTITISDDEKWVYVSWLDSSSNTVNRLLITNGNDIKHTIQELLPENTESTESK
ncbi:hypothetical protein [Methylobacter sp. YRD-M1]|uniref:hypothetical protein n=1 Tax=Methylobacter sp. YRD-M1 TaxID=2911520 RepID=UPI00227B5F46|nr:hypothetical protein [Methylobacter sp. YRD-M1]WAK01847.1 hypothetical protein LZ558_18840 [Methylobacter sp. YRD-M1]